MVFSRVALVLMLLVVPTRGNFLAVKQQSHSVASLEQTLLLELAGAGNTQKNIDIMSELKGLYVTLPKNEEGRLESPVVRYALHRYFTSKYGWHLQGISKQGAPWNASSPLVKNDRIPEYMMNFFEKRAHGHGVSIDDLSVFVAALSDVIAQETLTDAENIWDLMDDPVHASEKEMKQMIAMNLVARLHGVYVDGMSLSDYEKGERATRENNLLWSGMETWAHDLLGTYKFSNKGLSNPFENAEDTSYDQYIAYVHDLTHKFGTMQNLECKASKRLLMNMESEGTGRVSLAKFYSGAGTASWPFTEKVDYLRNLGALDESLPGRPSVIIPNYVNSLSNCLFPSDFYSVCCIDECEGLMAKVESAIAQPAAKPMEIARIISRLGSETVEAPRNLSAVHVSRLSEIADLHDGLVPLHSRLFAQWMHHSYPRECPFPHMSGAASPLAPHDWTATAEVKSIHADDTEMSIFSRPHHHKEEVGAETDLPWSPEEELIGIDRQRHVRQASWKMDFSPLRSVFLIAAMMSVIAPVVRSSKSAFFSRGGDASKEEFFV